MSWSPTASIGVAALACTLGVATPTHAEPPPRDQKAKKAQLNASPKDVKARALSARRALTLPGEEPLSADELERSAIELGERSNRGRAIEFLERALKLEPQRGRLYRLLGVLYRDTGRIAKAERSFRKATRLDPDDPHAWADLAAVLERSGSHRDALKAANRAVALSKDDPGIRADRAIIRYRLGQLDAAIDDGEAALRGLEDAARFEADVAMMRLTRGRKDDMSAAVTHLSRARALLRDDPAIALAYAQALLASGRTELAKEAYSDLIRHNRNQAWVNWGRGLLAFREQKWALARQHGRQARKVLPHVFHEKGHNRRQFFSKDALAYLRWLDDELASSQSAARAPGGPAVLERLVVEGECKRERIKQALEKRIASVRACFAEHSGPFSLRFKLHEGRAKGVTRQGTGISRDVDTCLLRLVRGTTFPRGLQCKVEVAYNRPVQARRGASLKGATSLIQAPKVLSPELRGALIKPERQPEAPPRSREQNAQER